MLHPSAPGSVAIELVSRAFKGARVLLEVSLGVGSGGVTAIHGDNGSGKTTLLRILAGTLAPDAGRALVCGVPPGRGHAAFVAAGDRAAYWRLTALQELTFFARLGGADERTAHALAVASIDALGLDGLAGRQIGTLSTGQRRRVMVARSLVGRAPVLLLDEPYADLDERACEHVREAASAWSAGGGAVIWTAPTDGGGPEPDATFRLIDGSLHRA